MTAWHEGTLAALGLETTGDDVETGRITAACIMRVNGSGRDDPSIADWRIGPGAEQPGEAIPEIVAMLIRVRRLHAPIVGFDVSHSLTLLDRECRRHQIPTLSSMVDKVGPVVCARILDRAIRRTAGPRSLADACEHWGVSLEAEPGAAAIAWASAGVVVRIAQRNLSVERLTLEQLQARQAEWHSIQRRAEAHRLRRMAGRGPHVDDQLELHARAEQAEAQAEHWPVAPYEQQGALT